MAEQIRFVSTLLDFRVTQISRMLPGSRIAANCRGKGVCHQCAALEHIDHGPAAACKFSRTLGGSYEAHFSLCFSLASSLSHFVVEQCFCAERRATEQNAGDTSGAIAGFSGALTGTTDPQNLILNGPAGVTASFKPLLQVIVTELTDLVARLNLPSAIESRLLSILEEIPIGSGSASPAQRAALATTLQALIPEVRTANAIGLMSGPQTNQLISYQSDDRRAAVSVGGQSALENYLGLTNY